MTHLVKRVRNVHFYFLVQCTYNTYLKRAVKYIKRFLGEHL